MEKDGELNVLHDILACDGDLDSMETVDDPGSSDDLQMDKTVVSSTSASMPRKNNTEKASNVGDNKLKLLAEERQRLEKENKEKKRRLEDLRKQEMLIEEAATKGEYIDRMDTRIADIDYSFMSGSRRHKHNKEDKIDDSGSDLFSSYETLSEESGSSDDSISDKDDLGCQSMTSCPSESHSASKSRTRDIGKKHRVKISPVRWKTDGHDSKVGASKSENIRIQSQDRHSSADDHHSRLGSSSRLSSRMEKLYKYIFLDAKFFLIKSGNHENVALAQAKGVWSTPPQNEARLNQAFRTSSNVILIFSVKESGRFQGFARIAAESDRNHPPIRWVLPPGLTARTLSGVFTLDWINRNELDFIHTGRLNNAWNENQPIRIGRDGQTIEPVAAEALCRLFPVDCKVDLHAIALKSREAMDRRKLDPHELYKTQEALRRQVKIDQHKLKMKQNAEARRQHNRSKNEDQRRLERLQNIVEKVASTIGVYNELRRGCPSRSSMSSRMFDVPVRRMISPPHREPYSVNRSSRLRGASPFRHRDGQQVSRPFVRSHSRDREFNGGYMRRPAARSGRSDASWHRMHDRRR